MADHDASRADAAVDRARFQQTDRLFDAVLDIEPHARTAFLREACGDDHALRDAVERLLRAHADSGEFLETPASALATPMLQATWAEPLTPAHASFGPFRVLRPLGEGGMGTVYLAERAGDTFTQQVAIKTVRAAAQSPALLSRFVAERRLLARIEHASVARLIDGSVTTDGTPWFAMEYVQGEPVSDWCDARSASVTQRLALFQTICDAVQYAHQMLVVHRDLKPSNILVTADGQVKLLDFGIAKLLEHEETTGDIDRTEATAMLALTPQYAAPEQLLGRTVTAATDVYSLGVLLCELLTGQRPYTLRGLSPAGAQRLVCDVDVPRITALPITEAHAAARGTTPDRLRRQVGGDLESIVAKALRKAPADRYATVAALRDDLARWRDGMPVRARPDDLPYRARRFASRNRVPLAAALGFAVLLSAGFARERSLRTRAEAEARKATAVTSYMVDVFDVADPFARNDSTPDQFTVRAVLDRGAARVANDVSLDTETQAAFHVALSRIYANLGLFENAQAQGRLALAQRRMVFGARHEKVAEAMDLLGTALTHLEKPSEAEPLLREAIAQRRELLGNAAPETAVSMEHLGTLLQDIGRLPEARTLFAGALQIRRLAPRSRKSDSERAAAMNSLGLALVVMGNYDEADGIYREALALQRSAEGAQSPLTPQIEQNLAQLQQLRGRPDEAEALFRQALATKRRLLGDAHPSVTINLNNLAAFLARERGKTAEARTMVEEALRLDRQLFGNTHNFVAAGLNNMASILRYDGDFVGSERAAREALAVSRASIRERNRETALAYNGIGIALMGQHQYGPALVALRDGRDEYAAVLGPKHLFVQVVQTAIARAQRESGDFAGAERTARDVIAALDTTQEAHRSAMITARVALARALTAMHRLPDAEQLLTQTEATSTALAGATNWRTLDARIALAAVRVARGDTAAGVAILREIAAPVEAVRITQRSLYDERRALLRAWTSAR